MNAVDFVNLCRSKRAAALMTPEAMQAAAPQPPPMDPAMAQGGMPPQGAPMPPPGAPMPPPGAPMPPPGAPMPPPGAPMPPQMDPAAIEQMFIEFAASQGITLDPQTGGAFDANGQPVPPEVIQQLMMQFDQMLSQGGGMPPPPPPTDPAMGGAPAGAPPPGAPMPPPQEGMPPEAAPPMEQGPDMAQLMADIQNNIESMVKAELSAQDKKIAAMMDKIDSMKSLLEQLVGTQDQRTAEDKKSDQDLDAMIQQELAAAQAAPQPGVPPAPAVEQLQPKQASATTPSSLTLLQKMRGLR